MNRMRAITGFLLKLVGALLLSWGIILWCSELAMNHAISSAGLPYVIGGGIGIVMGAFIESTSKKRSH